MEYGEGLGEAFYRLARGSPRGCAPARSWPLLKANRALLSMSRALVDEVQSKGKAEKERGGARVFARVSLLTGAQGRPVRVRAGVREEEREEGVDRPACCGRRGRLGGHEGEAQGCRKQPIGGGCSAPEHCSALQSVLLAGMAVPFAPCPCPLVSSSARE